MSRVLWCSILLAAQTAFSQPSQISSAFKIGRLKYSGGGDWYNDPSAEVNLLKFVKENGVLPIRYDETEAAREQIKQF